MTEKGFKIDENKGFKITFDNGVTVSVQFGGGNYCSNRIMTPIRSTYTEGQECINAEVGIWDIEGEWITKEFNPELFDDVIGYCTPSQVLALLIWAERYGIGDEHNMFVSLQLCSLYYGSEGQNGLHGNETLIKNDGIIYLILNDL